MVDGGVFPPCIIINILRNYFLQINKDIWKQLKTKIIITISIIFTIINNFIIISILYIQGKLTKLHEFTLITSLVCLLIEKVHMGKLK